MKSSHNRIAFFGTPNLAVYVLEELFNAHIIPTVVITAPDKPAGRALALTPPPVKVWAEKHEIPVLQISSCKRVEEMELILNSEWDLFIVAAYNILLPEWLLRLPKFGTLNVHPSLLPKLRGPSPIRTAIRDDLRNEVGVSVIDLDTEMDHGPLIAQANIELPVWPEKGRVLDELLFREGGRLLSEVIPLWLERKIIPEEQEHAEATYTSKIEKTEGEIVLTDDAYQNYCKFCAHDEWPGTFFFAEDNKGKKIRIKITDAEYHDGVFSIKKVIPEGKKEVAYDVWKSNFSW